MANRDGHKRRKIAHEQLLPSGNIRGSFELHNLLRFKQHGSSSQAKAGIDEFKNFCAEIAVNANAAERDVQLKVLKQYCDEQSSSQGEERDFADLLSTWALAGEKNDDGVLAAVPAALSHFFRAISSDLLFRDFGLSLCQTLLRREQLQLIDRGLSAPKSKAVLATSCLELLGEIVAFDGGAVVGTLFSRRDFVFKRFDTLLEPSSSRKEHDRDRDHRRRDTRSHAVRLLLALLKYLDAESKEELISQARLLHACLKGLSADSPALVGDFLAGLRRYIVDADVSRDSKRRFFNSNNLGILAQLYDYDHADADTEVETSRPVRDVVHDFLTYACTVRNGISVPQTGWYPKDFNAERPSTADGEAIDLGLESPYYSDDYSTSVPVKNSVLAAFLQKLSPSKDVLQAELLVRIFEHTPELVADYFCKKSKSLGAPKDEAEWRGQFAFIFSVINLPVPRNCGWWRDTLPSTPPPLSVVMESIIPRQLDRATLNQCLKAEDDVAVISAAKILIAIDNKLDRVLSVFAGGGKSKLWKQGARLLRDMVAARCPNFSEVVAAVQRADDAHHVREALLQYMAGSSDGSIAYDVGPASQRTLDTLQSRDTTEAARASLGRQVVSLIKLAGTAKSTKWASFVQLLVYAATTTTTTTTTTTHDGGPDFTVPTRDYLMPKLLEKAVLRDEKAFRALITAIRRSIGGSSTTTNPDKSKVKAIVQSLDNCVNRVTKQPVKYFDASNGGDVSLLACCLSEQWSYISDREASLTVGLFTAHFFACLEGIGEPRVILDNLRRVFAGNDQIVEQIEKWKRHPPEIENTLPTTSEPPTVSTTTAAAAAAAASTTTTTTTTPNLDLSTIFHPVQPIPASLSKLTSWSASNPDFETELQNPQGSRLAALLLLLSSPTSELRLRAHATLAQLTHVLTLPTCTYGERTSLHLLLGEVNETFQAHARQHPHGPLPTIVPSLAIFLLAAIANPADPMYGTANRFLLRAPTWVPLTRLLPYWTNVILLREPADDDGQQQQQQQQQTTSGAAAAAAAAPFVGRVGRWLDTLVAGLRTDQDMDLYRRAGVFERVCSLGLAPGLGTRRDLAVKILHLVHAGATVRGDDGGGSSSSSSKGADTLITRVGIRAWLAVVKAAAAAAAEHDHDHGHHAARLADLADRVAEVVEANKNDEYIAAWEARRGGLVRERDGGEECSRD